MGGGQIDMLGLTLKQLWNSLANASCIAWPEPGPSSLVVLDVVPLVMFAMCFNSSS